MAGRGRVIADTSMRELLAAASGDRVRLRTPAPAEAVKTLAGAGATVAATAPDVLLISHLSSERTVAALTADRVPFSEVSAHRATLEDAYLQLTKDAVEFSAARATTPPLLVPWRPTSGRRRDDRHPVPLPIQPGPDSFAQTVRAEWVKFRTVRGWVIGLVVAALAILALGLGPSAQGSCGTNGPASDCTQPLGPGGEQVTDSFYFAHQPLDGNGTITVRVTSLTGQIPDFSGGGRQRRAADAQRPGALGQGRDHHQGQHHARGRPTRR